MTTTGVAEAVEQMRELRRWFDGKGFGWLARATPERRAQYEARRQEYQRLYDIVAADLDRSGALEAEFWAKEEEEVRYAVRCPRGEFFLRFYNPVTNGAGWTAEGDVAEALTWPTREAAGQAAAGRGVVVAVRGATRFAEAG